jgi:hypothetical protein
MPEILPRPGKRDRRRNKAIEQATYPTMPLAPTPKAPQQPSDFDLTVDITAGANSCATVTSGQFAQMERLKTDQFRMACEVIKTIPTILEVREELERVEAEGSDSAMDKLIIDEAPGAAGPDHRGGDAPTANEGENMERVAMYDDQHSSPPFHHAIM